MSSNRELAKPGVKAPALPGNREFPKLDEAIAKELSPPAPEEVLAEVVPELAPKKSSRNPDAASIRRVVPPAQGVKVVALRPGFFKGVRRSQGDVFFVPSMEKVGNWMRCVDAKVEAALQKMKLDKKNKVVAVDSE